MLNTHLTRKLVLFFHSLVLGCFLVGCAQQPAKDIVAEVNGVPIYFYEMNAYRDMLFQGLTADGLPPNDEVLRQQYGYALTCIIEQELVRQYLQRKKIHVDESLVVKDEGLVQGDYGSPEDFQEALIEGGVSLELWHQMMKRRQDVQTLIGQVLRPRVVLSSEEIEEYYTAHRDEFYVSEQLDFLYIESLDKEKVVQARDVFLETRDASLTRTDAKVYVRDVRLSADRLPEDIVKEIAAMAPYTGTDIKKFGEHYYTYVLREKVPAGLLDIGQTFKRIEQTLVEKRVQLLLDSWLQREFSKSTIRVVSPLLHEIVLPADKPLLEPRSPMKDDVPSEEFEDNNDEDATYGVEFFDPAIDVQEKNGEVEREGGAQSD